MDYQARPAPFADADPSAQIGAEDPRQHASRRLSLCGRGGLKHGIGFLKLLSSTNGYGSGDTSFQGSETTR